MRMKMNREAANQGNSNYQQPRQEEDKLYQANPFPGLQQNNRVAPEKEFWRVGETGAETTSYTDNYS